MRASVSGCGMILILCGSASAVGKNRRLEAITGSVVG